MILKVKIDFSCLSTPFIVTFGADSNALSLVSCIWRHGCDTIVIESKIEDLDLYILSVKMSETIVTGMVLREIAWLALES